VPAKQTKITTCFKHLQKCVAQALWATQLLEVRFDTYSNLLHLKKQIAKDVFRCVTLCLVVFRQITHRGFATLSHQQVCS
jgi:hypothetical protein